MGEICRCLPLRLETRAARSLQEVGKGESCTALQPLQRNSSVQMQSLLPHLPMEAQPAPPPPAPEPIPNSNAEALPLPPCFLELVKQQAERALPSKACTPMLLQRANMLLQDAVDAASMCMRAHVDSPTLLKHLLGAEHYNVFLRDDDKVRALDLPEEDGGPTTTELNAWSSLVTEHVGEVGPPPWAATLPPPKDAPKPTTPPTPSSTSASHCHRAAGVCAHPRRRARADLRQPDGVGPQAARGTGSRRLLLAG